MEPVAPVHCTKDTEFRFFKSCVVHYEFSKTVARVKAPRNVTAAHKKEMLRIRQSTQEHAAHLVVLEHLIHEIELHVEEQYEETDTETPAETELKISISLLSLITPPVEE